MKTLFGSVITEESYLYPESWQASVIMSIEHDVHQLLKSYRVVKYLGIGYDYYDGYRKLLFEVEE